MPPEDKLSCIWRKNHTEVSFYRKYWWNNIFIASCLCSLFVDPLFLYVPILKDDFKCLMLDPKLKIIVLLLRSLTDFFYLMDIIIRIYRSDSGSIVNRGQHRMDFSFVLKSCVPRIVKTIWASNDIIIDIVALLPFPQVAVFIFFSKMCDLRSLTPIRMVLTNVFAVLQYVPRVLRIYLSSNELKKNLEKDVTKTPIWIKGVLNFCMYTIASHVSFNLYPYLFLFVKSILIILVLIIRRSMK
nr:cyclic nucleotide-gated ion channel 1-like [Malus domestica]